MADTGNGATISGSTTTTVFDVVSITGPEETVVDLDVTPLTNTTGRERLISGDIKRISEIEVVINWRVNDTPPPVGGAPETWTLTLPPQGTATTAKSLAGTGYVNSLKYPDLANDQVMQGNYKIKFDGATGPTYT